jgi:hypothetical protein
VTCRLAAVDDKLCSGGETRFFACQVYDKVGDLSWGAEATEGLKSEPSVAGVKVGPGCTELHRTPSGPSSSATDFVRPRRPNLDAL